jgi:hypothetical protein
MITKAEETLRSFETARDLRGGSFDDAYLARLRQGDDETARHFDRYFRSKLRAKIWGRFGPEREEDLVDEMMTAAMVKILQGKPRTAACLKGYIFGICSNLFGKAIRAQPNCKGMDLEMEDAGRHSLRARGAQATHMRESDFEAEPKPRVT